MGLEPTTLGLGSRCSTAELRPLDSPRLYYSRRFGPAVPPIVAAASPGPLLSTSLCGSFRLGPDRVAGSVHGRAGAYGSPPLSTSEGLRRSGSGREPLPTPAERRQGSHPSPRPP